MYGADKVRWVFKGINRGLLLRGALLAWGVFLGGLIAASGSGANRLAAKADTPEGDEVGTIQASNPAPVDARSVSRLERAFHAHANWRIAGLPADKLEEHIRRIQSLDPAQARQARQSIIDNVRPMPLEDRIRILDALVAENMDDPMAPQVLYLLGDMALAAQSHGRAAAYYRRALGHPERPTWVTMFALQGLRKAHEPRDMARAIEYSRRFLDEIAENVAQGRFAEVGASQGRVVGVSNWTTWMEEARWLAEAYEKQGNVDEAVAMMQGIIERSSRRLLPKNWRRMGELCRRHGRQTAALAAFHRSLEFVRDQRPARGERDGASLLREVQALREIRETTAGRWDTEYLRELRALIDEYSECGECTFGIKQEWAWNVLMGLSANSSRFSEIESRQAFQFQDETIRRNEKRRQEIIAKDPDGEHLITSAYVIWLDAALRGGYKPACEETVDMLERFLDHCGEDAQARAYLTRNLDDFTRGWKEDCLAGHDSLLAFREQVCSTGP